jgi:tripartite-type tricarboxylate transporter receptor subunit TctC
MLCLSFTASAQSASYPARPIQFVVGFAAGGSTDIIARVIGKRMSALLGQPIVVINQPGADSMIAATRVAQAKPDGYTILVTSGGHAANAVVYPDMKPDPRKDFTPVSLIGDGDNFLVVHPSLSVNSVREFVALAKQNPGKYNFGSAASLNRLAIDLFDSTADIKTAVIPYKGAGALVPALVSGEVDISITAIVSVLQYVKSGKLRALAVTGAKRSGIAPDVPTVAESGFPGYNGSNWYGMLAPANTPREIVQVLNTTLHKVLQEPELRAQLEAQGLDARPTTPEEFTKLIQADVEKWGAVSKVLKESSARSQ